jgi:hypothetical protein
VVSGEAVVDAEAIALALSLNPVYVTLGDVIGFVEAVFFSAGPAVAFSAEKPGMAFSVTQPGSVFSSTKPGAAFSVVQPGIEFTAH